MIKITRKKTTFEERTADNCIMCNVKPKKEFDLCPKCLESARHDINLLTGKQSTIPHNKLRDWIKKHQGSKNLLFVQGHWNEHPEELECPYRILRLLNFGLIKKSNSTLGGKKPKTRKKR